MSYRCSFCNGKVPAGVPLKRYIKYRLNRQIESERPICARCMEFVGQDRLPTQVESIKVQQVEIVSQPEARRITHVCQEIKEKPVPLMVQQRPEVKPAPIKGKTGAVGVGLAGTLNRKNSRTAPKGPMPK